MRWGPETNALVGPVVVGTAAWKCARERLDVADTGWRDPSQCIMLIATSDCQRD
jgi:hypothetical protein